MLKTTMKILHIDIETAPHKVYCWGLWKQNIAISQIVEAGYTLCWAAKWEGKSKVMFNSLHVETEEEMLAEIWDLLDKADAVVHYNGERFDIPTLNGEFAKLGWEPPSPYHHIDLLKIVKKRFRLPSNKLDYVCQYFELGAKFQHAGMALWTKCMQGDDKAWKIMERYNKQDVKLLPKLYHRLIPWIQNHPNHGLYTDELRPVCPNCGSIHVQMNGTETTKTMVYQRYRCFDCGTPIRGRTTVLAKDRRPAILTGSKL